MQLNSHLRPTSPNGRVCWQRENIIIPNLEIWPLDNSQFELSIWLPIRDQTFASMRFSLSVSNQDLLGILEEFRLDPELTCEKYFGNDIQDDAARPELRYNKPDTRPTITHPPSSKSREKVVLTNIQF